jgi:hypothetical protein
MTKCRFFTLYPVTGWGWIIAGLASMELPPPFRMEGDEVEPGHWTGRITQQGHPLDGRSIDVSRREAAPHMVVMIEGRTHLEPQTVGFATLWEGDAAERP